MKRYTNLIILAAMFISVNAGVAQFRRGFKFTPAMAREKGIYD